MTGLQHPLLSFKIILCWCIGFSKQFYSCAFLSNKYFIWICGIVLKKGIRIVEIRMPRVLYSSIFIVFVNQEFIIEVQLFEEMATFLMKSTDVFIKMNNRPWCNLEMILSLYKTVRVLISITFGWKWVPTVFLCFYFWSGLFNHGWVFIGWMEENSVFKNLEWVWILRNFE